MPLRVVFKKALKGLDPLRDSLGIVEPIDAQDELGPAEAVLDLLGERRTPGVARQPAIDRRLDAHRERAYTDPEPIDFVGAATNLPRALRDQIVAEIVAIVLGLEADEIVMGEASENVLMRRQGLQDIGWSEGYMEEESNSVLAAPGAQFATERHKVIIMNPNDVVLADERAQLVGKPPVDAHIPRRVGPRIFL